MQFDGRSEPGADATDQTAQITHEKETGTMDELIALVSKKTGISKALAKQVVETVIGYLKGKLPAPIARQIDGILSGDTAQVANAAKGLGGLLGKK